MDDSYERGYEAGKQLAKAIYTLRQSEVAMDWLEQANINIVCDPKLKDTQVKIAVSERNYALVKSVKKQLN